MQEHLAALIWTDESLVGPHALEVLDSSVFAEAIDVGGFCKEGSRGYSSVVFDHPERRDRFQHLH
jgi:hypothetical protein